MKNRIVTIALVLVGILSFEFINAQELTLDKEVHDYGTIKQGANGECVFIVKNTGTAPLIISACKGSCGCTVPQCDKAPIAPGGSQEVKVKYDTKRIGAINKSVTITSNATNTPTKVIRIKGNILAQAPAATPVPAK
ncbi:DUF1573 domain-containing protein [Flavobacteriales bacterium]|nr:DUF1573 domain-containing protein [Flavobacteriales bacterium]MDC3336692.1 DUF1573 domain-containing protein [Flavobacteriales bacterium]